MSHIPATLIKGLVGAAVLAATSTAFTAQESRTLLVTASIPGGCTLTTTPMAFGTLNVAAGTDETHTATATYKCALGVIVNQFSVGTSINGTFAGTMTGSATTDVIPYTISWTPPAAYTGEGFATGKTVQLNGLVKGTDYVTKSPDNYSQSVTVSINF